jgi:hypothetical protein
VEKKHKASKTREAGRKGFIVAAVIAIVSLGLIWVWLNESRRGRGKDSPALSNSPPPSQGTNVAGGSSTTRPEFQKLAGKWVRPDGGYILQIRGVDNIGIMDAAYFNPDPIHVAKAAAFTEAGTTRVYVELRDVNYPGCTYTLTYDPNSDLLAGDYFQAAIQQHYEVEFIRQP